MARLSDLYELHIHGNTYHSQDYITSDYVENFRRNIIWQDSVKGFYDPSGGTPSSPNYQDRGISTATANGWTVDYIHEGDGESWLEIAPQEGYTVYVDDENRYYVYISGGNRIETILDHNVLDNLQGGIVGEYYHLQQSAYDNLKNQDQQVETTSDVTFSDITFTDPASAYNLSHDLFADFIIEEHRQGEYSIPQVIHDDNIASSSITQHEGDITHNNLGSIYGDAEGYHLQQSAYDNLKNQDQEVYSSSLPNFEQITIDSSPTSTNHVARKDYVDGLFQEGMYGQEAVIDFYDFSTAEPSASDGDRYISSTTVSASGFTENYIYEYSAPTDDGIEYAPEGGWTSLVDNENRLYYYKDETDEGIKLANFVQHNSLNGLQGGTIDEYYHITQSQHSNLTSSNVEFTDITITSPSSVYNLSHDSFADFSSAEHIDWTITGVDTIHDDRIAQSSITQYETFIDHDALTNFVSNEHINHSGVSISSGGILSGGGDLTANRTISLNNSDITHNSVSGINGSADGYHLSSTEYSNYNYSNWDAAYSHVSSNGTDHSYINQSVTTSDSPTFSGIKYNNVESTAGSDGDTAFDASEGLLIYRNQQPGNANSGDDDYVILDGANISAGNGINISGGKGSAGAPITFSAAQTISTSDPSGGSDGDVWYKV